MIMTVIGFYWKDETSHIPHWVCVMNDPILNSYSSGQVRKGQLFLLRFLWRRSSTLTLFILINGFPYYLSFRRSYLNLSVEIPWLNGVYAWLFVGSHHTLSRNHKSLVYSREYRIRARKDLKECLEGLLHPQSLKKFKIITMKYWSTHFWTVQSHFRDYHSNFHIKATLVCSTIIREQI